MAMPIIAHATTVRYMRRFLFICDRKINLIVTNIHKNARILGNLAGKKDKIAIMFGFEREKSYIWNILTNQNL